MLEGGGEDGFVLVAGELVQQRFDDQPRLAVFDAAVDGEVLQLRSRSFAPGGCSVVSSPDQNNRATARSETTWVCQERGWKEAMGVFIMESVRGLFIDHFDVRPDSGSHCNDLLRCVLLVGIRGIGPVGDAGFVWRHDSAAGGKR